MYVYPELFYSNKFTVVISILIAAQSSRVHTTEILERQGMEVCALRNDTEKHIDIHTHTG
jgi:hypothetical protein